MEYTGERMVPGRTPKDTTKQHVQRYQFAADFVQAKRVIDVGCGAGYGCEMLGRQAAWVSGIDNSAEAIEYANGQDNRCRTSFHVGDAIDLGFNRGAFEVAVCFEVLEHLEDPGAALAEMRRVLEPAGLLIASTPNKRVFSPGAGQLPPNPWHKREWTPEEFMELIEDGGFALRAVLGQTAQERWRPRVAAMLSGMYTVVVAQARTDAGWSSG